MKSLLKFLLKLIVNFFVAVIANFVSIFLFFAVLPILFIAIIISSTIKFDKGIKVTNNLNNKDISTININFDNPIVETPVAENFNIRLFDEKPPQTTFSLCEKISSLAQNNSNKAIVLSFGEQRPSFNQLVEIRKALLDYKKFDKKIYVFLENSSAFDYYLASVADKIYIDKLAYIEFKGLAIQGAFFGDAFKKYGVDVEVIKVGKQKSFGEMFTSNKMSPLVKENYQSVLNSLWDSVVSDISNSRNIEPETLKNIANKYAILSAKDALELKLVDSIVYKDEFVAEMKELLGKKSKSIVKYDLPSNNSKECVAIVYMNGTIIDSDDDFNAIGSTFYAKLFDRLRKNRNVKSVVLRINSGGGSAYASETIRRSVELLAKEKPVVASVSSTCASGAYWISTACNKIVMQDQSISGSIGVFSIYPSINKIANDYGITFDTVKTSDMADLGSIANAPSDKEIAVIQKSTDEIYAKFVELVSESRKIEISKVEEFADGRIFSGSQALDINLCDTLGTLSDAVALSAELADIDFYNVVDYPKFDPSERFFRFFKSVEKYSFAKSVFEFLSIKGDYENMIKSKGVYARIPFDFEVK